MTTNFDELRARLQSEQKRLLEESEQLEASIRPAVTRGDSAPDSHTESWAPCVRCHLHIVLTPIWY